MIRQVIAKIDCDDEYCSPCQLWEVRGLDYVCYMFEGICEKVQHNSFPALKRCDACKQAEAQAKQPAVVVEQLVNYMYKKNA